MPMPSLDTSQQDLGVTSRPAEIGLSGHPRCDLGCAPQITSTEPAVTANKPAVLRRLRSSVVRRRVTPSTATATMAQLGPRSRYREGGQVPPHIRFVAASSFAITSSSGVARCVAVAILLQPFPEQNAETIPSARTASACPASREALAAAVRSSPSRLLVAMRASALFVSSVLTLMARATKSSMSEGFCAAPISIHVRVGAMWIVAVESRARATTRTVAAIATVTVGAANNAGARTRCLTSISDRFPAGIRTSGFTSLRRGRSPAMCSPFCLGLRAKVLAE